MSAVLVVLTTLGIWSAIRTEIVNTAAKIPPWPMVLLVLLFSLSAIGMKVLHHNPYIERTKETDRDLSAATSEGDELVAGMGTGVAQYQEVVANLAGMGEHLDGQARRMMDQAFVAILRERDAHGLADDLAPAFIQVIGDSAPDRVFQDIVEPHVPSIAKDRIDKFLMSHDPEKFRPRWEHALEAFRACVPKPGPGVGS